MVWLRRQEIRVLEDRLAVALGVGDPKEAVQAFEALSSARFSVEPESSRRMKEAKEQLATEVKKTLVLTPVRHLGARRGGA